MKTKLLPLALLALVSGVVSGCPVYDDDPEGCVDDYDCSVGYYCEYATGACIPEGASSCERPSDCAGNETCSKSGICAAGDCHFASVGCVTGFECSSDSGRWECVPEGSSSGGKGQTGGAPSAGGAPSSAEGGAGGGGGDGG